MKEDSFFLLDEISLADDSVLERLNRYIPYFGIADLVFIDTNFCE